MDKLVELLQQIQDLAGVAIEALQGATEGGESEGGGEGGPPPAEGGEPPAGPPPGAEG